MRILFLADAVFDDKPGGSRVAARELAHGLVAQGHDITFLVARHDPKPPGDTRVGGIRIVRYGGAGRADQFVREGRAACAQLWKEAPFDVVHTHFAYAALGPTRAMPLQTPHVRTFHGPWDEEGWVEDVSAGGGPVRRLKAQVKRQARRRIEIDNLSRASEIIVLSEFFGKLLADRYHVPPNRVHKIPGGANIDRFVPASDKKAVRSRLGLPPERRILLSIRRLAPRMGLDNLIQAMPIVVARHPDVLLLIGGKGPELERLGQLIDRLQMQEYVRLLGFIPDDQLSSYYQASDLFVLPTSALEGFGLVIVEALASGVPVIGTPVGAIPEILGGLDKRLIANSASPEAIADCVLSFLEDSWSNVLTPTMLAAHVREHYNWAAHVAKTEAVYEKLLSKQACSLALADP